MDIRVTELVLRKLIDAMERRCAGFPIRYELELLTIETAKEQLDKIQAELNAPANIQQQVQPVNGGMCTRPDMVDCHAKVGTGGRCMNIVPCPPLQVN